MAEVIAQFQGDKPVLRAILTSLGEELDELHAVFAALRDERWIDTGRGAQLDGIGTIVDRSRVMTAALALPWFGFYDQPGALGFDEGRFREAGEDWAESYVLGDPEYRMVLWEKVFKNSSLATTEDTIRSYRFIFGAKTAYINERGNAKFAVGIGKMLTKSEIFAARAYGLHIRAGGVGVDETVYFDPDSFFGFDDQPSAKGFDEGIMAEAI